AVVGQVHGRYRVHGGPDDLTDLTRLAPEQLRGRTRPGPPVRAASPAARRRRRGLPLPRPLLRLTRALTRPAPA
ncbi:hypothetical protein, partial [Spinactinospora alkalitolerans]